MVYICSIITNQLKQTTMATIQTKGISREFKWKVDSPALLQEIASNHGVAILKIPLNIFQSILAEVAERATEINDPILNELMIDLNLYELPPLGSNERKEIVGKARLLAQELKEKNTK